MSGGWLIDSDMLALFMHARRTQVLKMTDRQAAADAGVAAATIVRVENKQKISAANFCALCLWLGVDPLAFLIDPATGRHVPSRRMAVSRPDVSHGTATETAESRAA